MILLAFQQLSLFHPLGEYATGQIAPLWRRMAALQLVGMEQPFPRSGGVAASRSSRRAACRASLPAFTLIALMPYSGLQAQFADVQAGARHAAQACRLSPHNRTLYPVQLRFLG